jgi:hypothetical protein
MNSIALMVVLSATGGLFGGRQAAPTCTTGSCPTPATYAVAPAQVQAQAPVAATYSSYYYAPQQVQAAAPAAPVARQAAPTYYYAPAQQVQQTAQYTRYYYPTATTYPAWSGSCPNGNCTTVR